MIDLLRTLLLFTTLIFIFSCHHSWTPVSGLNYHTEPNRQFWSADWSPDGKLIAVAGVDSTIYVLNARTLSIAKKYRIEDWIHVVEWHPSRSLLAVGTLEKYVHLIDTQSDFIIPLDAKGGTRGLGWNANGTLLGVADLDGHIHIWNSAGTLYRRIEIPYAAEEGGRSFLSLDWHPANDTFVATNEHVRVMTAEGNEVFTQKNPTPEAILLCSEWHPSGEFLVTGNYGHNWEGENVPSLLEFWDMHGNRMKTVYGSKGEYRNLAWNPKGTKLATASDILRIWSDEGKLLKETPADSTNYLWGIDWSPNGKRIVTASRYKSVALWSAKGKLLKRIEIPE